MKQQLEKIYQDALNIIQNSQSVEEVDKNKNQFIGKKGQITQILKGLKQLSLEEKKSIGKRANEISLLIEKFSTKTKNLIKDQVFEEMSKNEQFDFLQPIKKKTLGRLHPISQIQYEIEDIFTSMGFSIMDGMEIESDNNNFSALNFSQDHPARDMQDTFYLKNGYLLRTHTSSVQVHALKNIKPPFQMIAPGRVFRYEEVDASHETTFYQVEGMVVAKNVSISNLVYVMQVLLKEIFQTDKIQTRLRPGYFPFVEPGFELDISCLMCEGNGCQVCKKSGWLELLPCGLVHPNVFSLAGLSPKEWSGFAFGLGLDRLVMMRYGINDIRYFHSGNLRFLQQF